MTAARTRSATDGYLGSTDGAKALGVRSARDAVLGDDGRHIFVRRDVESGIFRVNDSSRGAPDAGDFFRRSLLDRDIVAGRQGEIDRARGGGHVEGYVVFACEDCELVGADLVCDVAVRGDSVGAGDYDVDFASSHVRAGGAVDDNGGADAIMCQFPRCQARALEERPGFVDEDALYPAIGISRANYTEGCAVAARRKCARVAVGQHRVLAAEQRGAELADAVVGLDVLLVDSDGFGGQAFADCIRP